MPIPVACPCGARLKVPEGSAGKKVKCPKCAALLSVPAEWTSISEAPPPAAEKPCPFCAEPIDPAAPKCPFCHQDLAKRETPTAKKTCPYCAETIQAAAKVCPFCRQELVKGATRRAAPARDLSMEGHLRAIAVWYRIGGVLCALIGVFFLIAGGSAVRVGTAELGCVMGVLVAMGAFLFLLGHFLWRYANWARITSGVFTILGMLFNLLSLFAGGGSGAERAGNVVGVLFSMAWSAAYLWAFFSSRTTAICSPAYVANVERHPDVKPNPYASPFFWVPLAFVGLAIVIGVVAGAAMAVGGPRRT